MNPKPRQLEFRERYPAPPWLSAMGGKRESDWLQSMQAEIAKLEFLRDAGLDPWGHVHAKMAEGDGFELPKTIQSELMLQAVVNLARRKHYQPPAVDAGSGLLVGPLVDTLEPAVLPASYPRRILIVGSSGAGKTNLTLLIIKWMRKLGIKVLVWEYKPELGRVIPTWKDAIIFTPRTAPWQFLKPVGPDKLAFYIGIISEIRHELQLRPETAPILWSIIERILRGMKPGDPPFSFEDWRRVIEHEAAVQHRENLYTAARAILNICVVLGPQAAARIVPEIPEFYRVVGFDFVGQDPAILRLFLGFDFTRLLLKAQEEGHTSEFRQCYVFDEGSILFSAELMNVGVAHISAAKRFISMCRFAGTGFIIGCQNLCQMDAFVTQNCDVLAVFRCSSWEEATAAARLLGVDTRATEELMRLPTGVAYLRSAEWEGAVKVKVPLFEP